MKFDARKALQEDLNKRPKTPMRPTHRRRLTVRLRSRTQRRRTRR